MVYLKHVSYLPFLCVVTIIPFLIIPGETQVMFPTNVINCTTYTASLPCLPGDRSVFCLTNGTTVRGICEAQKAVCEEQAEVADSMTPCLEPAPANNTAISFLKSSDCHKSLQVFSSSLLMVFWQSYFP